MHPSKEGKLKSSSDLCIVGLACDVDSKGKAKIVTKCGVLGNVGKGPRWFDPKDFTVRSQNSMVPSGLKKHFHEIMNGNFTEEQHKIVSCVSCCEHLLDRADKLVCTCECKSTPVCQNSSCRCVECGTGCHSGCGCGGHCNHTSHLLETKKRFVNSCDMFQKTTESTF